MSGWRRVALWGAALAAAIAAFASAANDQDSASTPNQARAAIHYVYLCADCHGGIGEGNAARGAPPLAGRSARDLEQRLAQLRTQRETPSWSDHARVLGKLNQDDIDAIAGYLATLVPPPAIATH